MFRRTGNVLWCTCSTEGPSHAEHECELSAFSLSIQLPAYWVVSYLLQMLVSLVQHHPKQWHHQFKCLDLLKPHHQDEKKMLMMSRLPDYLTTKNLLTWHRMFSTNSCMSGWFLKQSSEHESTSSLFRHTSKLRPLSMLISIPDSTTANNHHRPFCLPGGIPHTFMVHTNWLNIHDWNIYIVCMPVFDLKMSQYLYKCTEIYVVCVIAM